MVKARLMPVTVVGTKTGLVMFTGRFIVPVVATVAGTVGVMRAAGTTVLVTVFVDAMVGCGAPILD